MYVSKTTRKPTKGELADLLAGSRGRNARHGITGILIYDRGYFAQVIEGPEEAIDSLLANIAKDPRHKDYFLVSAGEATERYFAGWDMDWADLDALAESDHAELRRYLRNRSVADRTAIYGALIAFMEDHASSRPAPVEDHSPEPMNDSEYIVLD
jgi:hypothetical protein